MGAASSSAHESVLSRHVLAGLPSRVRAQTSPWACQLSDGFFFSGGLRASSWWRCLAHSICCSTVVSSEPC